MTMHVIQFSGGIGSFSAALRVAQKHGTSNLVLLIADTARNWKPWRTRFPLCAKREPARTKEQLLDEARALGIEPPRLYEMGFAHNNCGGTCVRAGQKQWKHTLDTLPARFANAEAQEQQLRTLLGDVSILRERRKGVGYPLPLAELRRRHHAATTDA